MYLKFGVVEAPVAAVLEEVGVAVAVAERVVDVVGDSVPVRDRLRVRPRHGRLLLGVELPVFRALQQNMSYCLELYSVYSPRAMMRGKFNFFGTMPDPRASTSLSKENNVGKSLTNVVILDLTDFISRGERRGR